MTRRAAVAGLVFVTLVWGVTFSVTKGALADASPLVLVAIRFTLATFILAPFAGGVTAAELRGGLLLGLLFWSGIAFQTSGLVETTPSRSAFITCLSAPLVPLVAWITHRAPPSRGILVAVLLAVAGLYLLTDPGRGGPNRGDLLTAVGAVLFAGHIVAAGAVTRRGAAIRLLTVQVAITAILAAVAAPLVGVPRLEPTAALGAALAFLTLTAIGTFWFQLRAQRVISAAQTGLIFTLEPVFASLTSWLAIGEHLSATQWLGGGLVVVGMVISARER